jgi:mono/diheme cytochrome c family protein
MDYKPRSNVFGNARFLFVASLFSVVIITCHSQASDWHWPWQSKCNDHVAMESASADQVGGSWYWMRSSEDEKRHVMYLYNRYCIRCHAVDGRGVWDIPDVPNFTNARWQASRADGQIVNSILKGRGAVMPPFRGTLSLEEAWAMSRYLRTLVPGTEASRPDLNAPEKMPAPK